jgi:hypothetical protein
LHALVFFLVTTFRLVAMIHEISTNLFVHLHSVLVFHCAFSFVTAHLDAHLGLLAVFACAASVFVPQRGSEARRD